MLYEKKYVCWNPLGGFGLKGHDMILEERVYLMSNTGSKKGKNLKKPL